MATNKKVTAPGDPEQDVITAAAAARMMKLKSSEAVAYHVRRKHLASVPYRHPDGTVGFRLRRSDVQAFIDASAASSQIPVFNLEEAARRLGVSAPEVQRLVEAGRLESAKPTPILGARGRHGLRFRQEHLDAFLATETDPANTMTVSDVCKALDLLGEEQVLHLAKTRGWRYLLRETNGEERLYVRRSDVEAYRASGDRALANVYTLDQAAQVIGYASSSVFRLARANKGLLRSVRDHDRIWIDADDARAWGERVKQRPPRAKRRRRNQEVV